MVRCPVIDLDDLEGVIAEWLANDALSIEPEIEATIIQGRFFKPIEPLLLPERCKTQEGLIDSMLC